MSVHITKYIYGQYLYEEAYACTGKVEAVAYRILKIIIMFTATVLVHVTKYIHGQHLHEGAEACTAK